MTFWDWLNRLGPGWRWGPGWPTERGWYALAMFAQTNLIIFLLAEVEALRQDDFFRQIANAIVITGWIGFIVAMQDRGAKDRDRADESMALTRAAVRAVTRERDPYQPASPDADGPIGQRRSHDA